MAENLSESAFRDWFLATMKPELVSPLVALLAHEDCPVSGEFFVVGGGRVAAYEVLIGTPAVANLIREGKTFQLPGTMQTSKHLGMVTMADSLLDLVLRGIVEPREAYLKAINKTEIRQLFHNAGVTIPDA